jgi:hypothetical protein
MSPKTGHHTVVAYTKAASLWREMRHEWTLPDEQRLHASGPDWLLILLNMLDRERRAKELLIMWRGWFLRNDIIFGKEKETIVGSAKFLLSYSETLNWLEKSRRKGTCDKGKAPMEWMVNKEQGRRRGRSVVRLISSGYLWFKDGLNSI